MRILISNDDGIAAVGIQTLRRALEDEHDLVVAAPSRQQSAMGHAISMGKPLYAKPVVYGPHSRGWRINGTPADCVKLAVKMLADEPFDLVLSGINHGSNLGQDVFYSGTVSAAMEGMFLGVPSIALSLEDGADDGFVWAASFVRWWLTDPGFRLPPPGIVYNVNFPSLRRGVPRRVAVVRLGHREYLNDFGRGRDGRGREYFRMAGERVDNLTEGDTDVFEHHQGAVTLTPLHMRLTDLDALVRLSPFEVPPWLAFPSSLP